ncbi:MAG: hypothetical protein ABH883_00495, partial [Candidatus Omnitrophota bacterium]
LGALGRLNEGDYFNIVAFRGDLDSFEKYSARASEKTIRKTDPFIRKLEATGQTDVANALRGIIEEPVVHRPSYVMLITDGRPTTGVIDSRSIIQEITRRNNRERPIFCFGGGRKVNRYLLEFISYQNRAWSRLSGEMHEMGSDFVDFYEQIKDPFLLNVRYRLNGVDPSSVYPKYLSDFYKGKDFTIYGRFDREDIFSMQLLGEINGRIKEIIYKGSLKNADAGGEDIAREWAFRKIYHLISQNTMGLGDPAVLRKEIESLSRKYNITTPYDIENGED